MSHRLFFFFVVCFFCWACFLPLTSVVFAMHKAKVPSRQGLSDNQHEILAKSSSTKSDNLFMVRIPKGTFKMGSSFIENKKHVKECRKYDKSCELWWFSDEFPDQLIFLDSFSSILPIS